LAAATGALIVGCHLALGLAFLGAIRQYWPSSDYGLPLRYSLDTREAVLRAAASTSADRTLIAGAGERDAVVYGLLRSSLPSASYFDASRVFVAPGAGTGVTLYLSPGADDPVGRALAAAQPTRVDSVRFPGRDPGRELYAASAAEVDAVVSALSPARSRRAAIGDSLELLGYDIAPLTESGRPVRVSMGWAVTSVPVDDIATYAHLVGTMGSTWGQWDGLPYPQAEWRAGDRLIEMRRVPTLAGTPPGEYAVEIGAYSRATGARLPVREPGRPESDRLRLGTALVTRPVAVEPPAPGVRVGMAFGDSARLESYVLDPEEPSPGRQARVTLFWRGMSPTSTDYTVFVHVADAAGRPVTQADGPPAYGGFPTSRWQPGDLVRDPRVLSLPRDLAPGRYWLLVGLYDAAGVRLAPRVSAGSALDRLGPWLERRAPYRAGPRADGDRVVLTAVDVTDPR
jgi:hypothetical protein